MRCLIAIILLLAGTIAKAQNADYIDWDKNRPLKWSDFKAKINRSIQYTASTSSRPYFTSQWQLVNGQYQLRFNVVCRFYKNYSFSESDAQTADVLAHEQTHFDISEFITRQLLVAFNSKVFTKENESEVTQIYDDMIVKLSIMQHTFDFETRHCMDVDRENEWETFVAKILDKNYTLQKALDKMPKSR